MLLIREVLRKAKMNFSECDKAWFAIQVRPKYEFITSTILRAKGYEELVPAYQSTRQWSDRRKKISVPIFTGYVFCRFNSQICVQILTTPGVIRIVGVGNRIVQIEDSEIEAIKMAVKSGALSSIPYINVGDRVIVNQGPMAGVQGILLRYSNRHQLVLSVDIIQGSVAMEIDAKAVTRIEPAAPATAGRQVYSA
jgi:transcription antitermination factor NusG